MDQSEASDWLFANALNKSRRNRAARTDNLFGAVAQIGQTLVYKLYLN